MDSQDPRQAQKRTRLRLPSVGVLLVIAVFVVCAGVVAMYRAARSGIRQVEALGGKVDSSSDHLSIPGMLSSLLDAEEEQFAYDRHVYSVQLAGPQITDEAIAMLGRFPSAETIILAKSSNVTDAGLARLPRFPQLTCISLKEMEVTGRELDSLTLLDTLYVSNCPRIDCAMIGRLSQLQNLYLDNCLNVDDAALAKIAGLDNLVHLSLSGSSVTDTGIQHLAGFRHLIDLDISGTRITDDGLKTLMAVRPNLPLLSIQQLDGITDEGVLNLRAFKSLRCLKLCNSNIETETVEKLHEVLPGCEIWHESTINDLLYFGVRL